MNAVLSDYFLNIDTRAEEEAAEEAAFEAWYEAQDLSLLLGAEADDLLSQAFCGYDISDKVRKLVEQSYREHIEMAKADIAFDLDEDY